MKTQNKTMIDNKRIQNFIRQFDKEKHNKSNSIPVDTAILIAISSAVGGALLGMLFAPEKGKKTRKNLVNKRDEFVKDLKKNTEGINQQLKKNTNSIPEKSKMAVQNLKQDTEDYAEWTHQELYDRAKKLQIKGYSQMNKSELIQAIEDL